MTKFFGIPWANEQHAVLYPGIGGRNVVVGLATLIMSFTGQQKAAGILLACAMVQGFCDARICWMHGDKWVVHALNMGIIGLVGSLSIRDGRGERWVDQAILAAIGGLLGWQVLRPAEGAFSLGGNKGTVKVVDH